MTDHKAEWVLVPRVATEAMLDATLAGMMLPAVVGAAERVKASHAKLYAAMLAAAPAASEGEDGAVAWEATDPDDGMRWVTRLPCERDGWYGLGRIIRPLVYGDPRPAAQVAATPKHDEGREASRFFIEHGVVHDSKTGRHVDGADADELLVLLRGLEDDRDAWRLTAKAFGVSTEAALATQPAARRVTVEDVERALTAFRAERGTYENETPVSADEMRAALESFAQPAEGVSRSDRDFPGDAEHENGDYENRCVQCGEVFTGYKRRVVCRVCAEKRGDTP